VNNKKEVKSMSNTTYGSVITEQGDLGLGVTPILENENGGKKEEEKKDKK
jgi:hypothetical protein